MMVGNSLDLLSHHLRQLQRSHGFPERQKTETGTRSNLFWGLPGWANGQVFEFPVQGSWV